MKPISQKWKGFNKMITAVRKRYPNFKGYVRVVEFQENGNPHIHVLLFGVDFIPVEWMRELWEKALSAWNSD